MDITIFSHMWAAGISILGLAAAASTIRFLVSIKKQFGGILGRAINYAILAFACTLIIILFYFGSGIYFATNGLRYPSWLTELVVSTSISLNLALMFLAAKTLKKGAELK